MDSEPSSTTKAPDSPRRSVSDVLALLLSWCKDNSDSTPDTLNPDAPFHEIRGEWGNRFILWEALEGWISSEFNINSFFPDELDARTTPRVLARHISKHAAAEKDEDSSLSKYENSLEADGLGLCPGLSERHAGYQHAEKVEEPTVFILGCPRSGTTLFRSMLAGHSQINSPPELHLLQFESLKSRERAIVKKNRLWMLDGLVQTLGKQLGLGEEQAFHYVSQLTRRDISIPKTYELIHSTSPKPILIDKSPSVTRMKSWMRRAEQIFTSPRYLFIGRHPMAVMESITRSRVDPSQPVPALRELWPIAEKLWSGTNQNIIEFLEEVPQDRWLHIRYEDLVTDPEIQHRQIAEFLDIPFEESTLSPYSGDRQIEGIGDPNIVKRDKVETNLIEKWKSISIPHQLSQESIALAAKLGYDSVDL